MKTKTKVFVTSAMFAITVLGFYQGIKHTVAWFDTHTVKFNQIVKVEINPPFKILGRVIEAKEVIITPKTKASTPIEEYICQKWGVWDCQTAIAVAKAEGMNHPADGFNINTNGTIDVGYFRINSIHFKKAGCSLKEIVDPYKNVDCAFSIYESQGRSWTAWVAFNNGSFKKYLK